MGPSKVITLKKNKEFSFVYHRGKSVSTRSLVLIYHVNRYGGVRSGFSISKKIGNAVVRNRIRRRMKEVMREALPQMPGHASLIFVAKPAIAKASYAALRKDMRYALKRAKLLIL